MIGRLSIFFVGVLDELIPNGVNGRYDDSDEHSENIKEGAESRLGLEDFGDSKESDTEKMESEECAEYAQHHDLLDDVDSEAMEIDGSKTDKDIESMEVDQRSNSSEVECLDEVNSEDGFRDENSQNNMRVNVGYFFLYNHFYFLSSVQIFHFISSIQGC